MSKASFYTMLRNRFYIGKIRVPKYQDEPECEVDGKHEALIDEDTFNMVQDVLDGNRRRKPKITKSFNPQLYLRQFIICPICGHGLTGATSRGMGGKYTYYNCCHNAKHIRVRAEKVNDRFLQYISCLQPKQEIVNLYREILKDVQHDANNEKRTKEKIIKEDIKKLDDRLALVEDKYMDGEITKEDYQRISDRYKKERNDLTSQCCLLESDDKLMPKIEYALNLLKNIAEYMLYADAETKIKIISSMFPNKIEFDGEEYRTNSYNQVLNLIFNNTKQLKGTKNKKLEKSDDISNLVPLPRIELGSNL